MTIFSKNRLDFFVLPVLLLLCFPGFAQRYVKGLSPQESMKTFQLQEGFGIEPFVTEPDVVLPVDMVFDEHGNVYVVEMGDYPYDAKLGNFKGRIRLLRDTNGDGKVDKSYVFAEELPSATSVLPWKGGLIVTAAPDILYLKDTNGDFKADVKEILFTGFFAKNSEAQITSLRFGVDNWIYANNHGQGGQITSKQNPGAAPVDVSGGDFRFRMDRGLFEVESGSGQFGLALDDWGHRFVTQNTLHIQQSPIAYRYIHRHNFMPTYRSETNISDHELVMFQKSATPYWRQQRSDRRQAKYDSLKSGYKEYARDHFTGASGGTFYGGDGFGASFYGSIFTGDVSGNLVHRDILKSVPGQPTYVASRDEKEKDHEFLAATDTWFRPANFTLGPDGYLYIVDMYRQHIETPVSIPEDLKSDMDFTNGDTYGRIWRLFPTSGQKRDAQLTDLSARKSEELLALLSHPNQWWRLTAQRMLLERQDMSIVSLLKKTFAESKDAKGRLHAFYVLEGLNSLDAEIIKKALNDAEPGVREHALVLAEKYPQYLPEIIKLTEDVSPQVAFQATLSLGQFSEKEVLPALAGIAEKHADNASYRLAILSSNPGSSADFPELLLSRGMYFNKSSDGKLKFIEDFAFVSGSRNGKNEISSLIIVLSKTEKNWQIAGLNGLTKGIKRSKNKKEADKNIVKGLLKLEEGASEDVKKAITGVRNSLVI
ncbi:dehydrogenase [Dyadobacter frigoris]|uniref:Dehydrogenase n=2 Tax=Dyadobacter frigoris TaxID=2576211 RepID=A0A4V6BHK0_9BACT|nr:dehydrogenase [Dyadobacter frigoris]